MTWQEWRVAMARAYAGCLWGRQEGYVAVLIGRGGNYRKGGYKFTKTISDFGRWPQEADNMLGDLIVIGEQDDVFVAPLLRTEVSRKKGTGIPGRHLYVDLDTSDHPLSRKQQETLRVLTDEPDAMVIASGREGHQHVYVPLGFEPASLDDFTALNRRLSRTLGGEKWDDSALLRLPGTYNHKGRANGGASHPVRMVDA